MKTFLTISTDIAKYLPAVLAGVVAVEQTIGAEAPGTAKKQIVADAIAAAAKVGESNSDVNVQMISTLIDSTVSAFNLTGLFGKKPAQPATPATPQA